MHTCLSLCVRAYVCVRIQMYMCPQPHNSVFPISWVVLQAFTGELHCVSAGEFANEEPLSMQEHRLGGEGYKLTLRSYLWAVGFPEEEIDGSPKKTYCPGTFSNISVSPVPHRKCRSC